MPELATARAAFEREDERGAQAHAAPARGEPGERPARTTGADRDAVLRDLQARRPRR